MICFDIRYHQRKMNGDGGGKSIPSTITMTRHLLILTTYVKKYTHYQRRRRFHVR